MKSFQDRAAEQVLSFSGHDEAVAFVVKSLAPFCDKIKEKPVLRSGLEPDIGIRLTALPLIPIAIEVKPFNDGVAADISEAIAQAASYAEQCDHAVFIAGLRGERSVDLQWFSGPVGSMLLVAGKFNVGGIYFGTAAPSAIGFMLAGVQVVFLSRDGRGPAAKLHSQAPHLLSHKSRFGSRQWRREAVI